LPELNVQTSHIDLAGAAPRRTELVATGYLRERDDQAHPRLLRRLRSKFLVSRRLNGRNWQRMTSISLKACRRNSI
jgi:hypothetical protein